MSPNKDKINKSPEKKNLLSPSSEKKSQNIFFIEIYCSKKKKLIKLRRYIIVVVNLNEIKRRLKQKRC
jgi:hypothetical protein